MASEQQVDTELYTRPFSFTVPYHRAPYPALVAAVSNAGADKVVLVTGSSKGIGRAVAISWATAGAKGVVITSRKQEDLVSVTEDIRKASDGKTQVLAIAGEINKDADVKNIFDKTKEKFGKLDVVVANAGVMGTMNIGFPKIGEQDADLWWRDQEVNVRGTHLTAHHYIRTFGATGTFITLTSGAATVTMPGLSSYGMSKSACVQIVEYLGVEYPELRSFSLNPGIVKGVLAPAFAPFGFDEPDLVGKFSVWLSTSQADPLIGGYTHVNWDVEELVKHGDEIKEKGMLKSKFLGEIFGPEGYKFEK